MDPNEPRRERRSAGDPLAERIPVVDAISMGEITLAVTNWCIKNCRSFDISADEGLHDLLRVFLKASSQYDPNIDIMDSLPHPTTVARAASESFEQVFCTVKGELAQIKEQGFSITSDIWTDMFLKRSYISVSVHYIHEHKLFNRLLAMRSMDEECCTDQQIQKEVEDCLQDFNLDLAGAIIVTDRESAVKSAFKLYDHIYCINHLLNNVVEKSFRDVQELGDMKQQATKLVRYLKILLENVNLKSSQQSDCPTRWNNIFYTLKSIEMNWHQINLILRQKNQLQRLKNFDFADLSSVVEVLSHFEEASKALQREHEPTLHCVIPQLRSLTKVCCGQVSGSSIGQALRRSLHSGLNSIISENITKFHRLALFLFPPTNLLLLFSEDEKTQTIDHCKELMKLIIDNSNECTVKDDDDNIFSDFTLKFDNSDAGEKIEREIRFYMDFGTKFSKNFCVLDWWKTNQMHFPIMYKLACKIFSIPASSVAAERVFSKARNLFCEQGNLIDNNPNMFNEILFLNDNFKTL